MDQAFDPEPGRPERLADGLVRVLAPNPSPLTFRGTNTYLLGEGEVVVLDPGPDDPAHHAALTAAIGGRRVAGILVTHAHLDHSPLARRLARSTEAPILAFGRPEAGRSDVMVRLAASGLTGGGEGVDRAFRPDRTVADGERLDLGEVGLTALHTPGHMGNHLAFAWGDAVFTGDLVMGWATSLVSPPDGDLTDFMASCRRLRGMEARVFHPGHGAPVEAPGQRLDWLLSHRLEREGQILDALRAGSGTTGEITARVYTDVPRHLWPAAERNVFAHLVDLHGRGLVTARPELRHDAVFGAG